MQMEGSNQNYNVNWWTEGDPAKWYIYEVNLTDEELSNKIVATMNAKKTSWALTPFDITEGATLKHADEIPSPIKINAALAAEATKQDIYTKEVYMTLAQLKEALTKYGTLSNHNFEVANTYATLCITCPAGAIEGLEFYTCPDASTEGVLNLTSAPTIVGKTPYIIKKTGTQSKFQIIGWNKVGDADPNVIEAGVLRGVLDKGTTILPEGSFILSAKDGVQAFYKMGVGTHKEAAPYKCYIELPNNSPVKALYFENEGLETAIENLLSEEEISTQPIYNLSGQQLNQLQKGINIVRGKKILVK